MAVPITTDAWGSVPEGGWPEWLRTLPSKGRRDSVKQEVKAFAAAGCEITRAPLAACYREAAALPAGTQRRYGRAYDLDVLADVEQKINEVLVRELDVTAEVMTMDQAREQGAIAMFGEKHGDSVRVVTIGDFSKELGGGTHVGNTAQLGLVKLLGESSIGSGVRRVEALVGADAYRFLAREHTVVAQLTELVKGRPEELPEKISGMLGRLKDAEKEIERFRAEKVLAAAAGLAQGAEDVRGVALVAARVGDGTGADELRKLVLDVRARLGNRPAVAARTTSRRAAARTRPPSRTPSKPSGHWWRSVRDRGTDRAPAAPAGGGTLLVRRGDRRAPPGRRAALGGRTGPVREVDQAGGPCRIRGSMGGHPPGRGGLPRGRSRGRPPGTGRRGPIRAPAGGSARRAGLPQLRPFG
ncbi:hypothetical protein KSE_32860 [Kitasatospora setae KM-6054]|uniref:Alanyl-transfer RNA synthetases family profile domain-containing protein n=1 Tax=Kitasatospora setae (strain ATCC 33774 / DSM 43861 / JCM 3304 / KCC A-0304 / NBRC 14216 / KM-6054) TaxID=452652 RepID=E4ND14_KITSK|nr:hypothetical protein KSE_32860 [Kitasatospora setae KM-6054]